jgi:hypothetical protein
MVPVMPLALVRELKNTYAPVRQLPDVQGRHAVTAAKDAIEI